ncbi:MAG: phytanoyl-CoA dioxygenase family protein [Burkholderiales bacterium]|nr:phytanoyl-CoA dioxygenase family protein [Burkholderiales bacterium]
MLSAEQRQCWHDEGCLVLPGFKPAHEVAALRERALALVDAFEPKAHGPNGPNGPEPNEPPAVFSTRDRARLADAALIASATEVHCFFEEEAVDGDGRLLVDRRRAINKIGHALHDRDPVFERFSRDARLDGLVRELGVAAPQLWQSMLIFKQPRIGGEVTWHQDASFLATEPESVLGLWFALEEATVDNGCLWIEPGGHRGPLRERFVRDEQVNECESGVRLRMQPLDATPWPGAERARPLPVPAGTLVVLHGLLPHYSAPNRSAVSRMAYTLHVTDGRARYSPHNWLQRGPAMPVRGFE